MLPRCGGGAMARFTLRLFGDFSVRCPNGVEAAITSRKAQAVLVFLDLAPSRSASRDQLIGYLWPDVEDHQARASLRKAIAELRRQIDPEVIVTSPGDKIQFSDDVLVSHLTELKRAVASQNWREAEQLLPDACTLEFWRAPTAEFDYWLIDRRRSYDAEVINVLLDGATRSDNAESRAVFAEAVLRIDPHNEAAACAGIMACAVSDPARAAAIQQRVQLSLEKDLGIAPAAATTDFLKQRIAAPNRRIDKPMLLIRPFHPLVHHPDYQYLGVALAEDLLSRLSCNRWLRVVADQMPGTYKPPSVFTDSNLDASARYTVSGTYLASANGVRMTARLTELGTMREIWSGRYDRAFADLMRVQDELSLEIAAEIEPAVIRAEEIFSSAVPEPNLDIWSRVMRARHLFWRTRKSDNVIAIELLREILAEAPTDVAALVTNAFALLLQVWSLWTDSPGEALIEAERCARTAVTTADQDPWAYFTHGTVLSALSRLDEARIALERAIALNPSFAAARGEYARILLFMGDLKASKNEALRALATSSNDPHASLAMNTLGLVSFFENTSNEAMTWGYRALVANPHWFHHHMLVGACARVLDNNALFEEKRLLVKKMVPNISAERLRWSHPFRVREHEQSYLGAFFA